MNRKHSLFFMLIIISAFCFYLTKMDTARHEIGESRHYVTSTITLLEKGSISFLKEDLKLSENIFGKFVEWNFPPYQYNDKTVFHHWATKEAKEKNFIGRSFYWGTYSALCIPVYWICKTFHLFESNMFLAFQVTNIIMLLIPLFFIAFYLRSPIPVKYALLLSLSVAPVSQYVSWASAECCLYMFVVMTIIFLYNQEYCKSVLCLCFAATLNYTIIPLGLVLMFDFFHTNKDQWTFSFKPLKISITKKLIKKILLLILCSFPLLHCMISTYLQYSSIATMSAMKDFSELFSRFWAYLFDLNFGIMIYFNILFFMFIPLLFIVLYKKDWNKFFLAFSFILTILSFSLMQHINCGMEAIARYTAWSSPLMVFFVVSASVQYISTKKLLWGIFCLFYLFNYVCFWNHLVFFKGNPDVYFTKFAEFMITYCPQFYNPLHSTFICRTKHVGGGYKNLNDPLFYTYPTLYPTKILLNEKGIALLEKEYYFPDGNISFSDIKQKVKGKKYTYINCSPKTVVKKPYPIHSGKITPLDPNMQKYLLEGFYENEKTHVWSFPDATIAFQIPPEKRNRDLSVTLHGWSFLKDAEILIKSNRTILKTIASGKPQDLSITIPSSDIKNDYIYLYLSVKNVASPQSLGYSPDSRILGFALQSFEIK